MSERFWIRIEELLVKHPGPFYAAPFLLVGLMFIGWWVNGAH